ncbi:MAG: hypothetical protein Q8O13_01325, partial [Candidatus Omnitrophota bacterium]|nr:hypothetical protein [Candidatus Omnitrophota bacterium]
HHDGVWVNLLEGKPLSVLTSFILGDCLLPRNKDIKRILGYTQKAWITTNPYKKKKGYKRDAMVEKTIKETVKSFRSLSDQGHIRLRLAYGESSSSWMVDLFGAAIPLGECVTAS